MRSTTIVTPVECRRKLKSLEARSVDELEGAFAALRSVRAEHRSQDRQGARPRNPLVARQLLPQDEVLEGERAVAAAQDREEPEHVEHEGDHRPGFSPYQGRLINHLVADRVLAKDRQAQYDRSAL